MLGAGCQGALQRAMVLAAAWRVSSPTWGTGPLCPAQADSKFMSHDHNDSSVMKDVLSVFTYIGTDTLAEGPCPGKAPR